MTPATYVTWVSHGFKEMVPGLTYFAPKISKTITIYLILKYIS